MVVIILLEPLQNYHIRGTPLVDTIKIDSSGYISSNYGSITNINTIDQMDKLYLYLSNGKRA